MQRGDDSIAVRLEEVLVVAPAVGEGRDVALIGDEILRVDEFVIAVCIGRTSGGRRSVTVAAGARKKKRTIWRGGTSTENVLMIVAAVALRKEAVLDAVDYVGTCEHVTVRRIKVVRTLGTETLGPGPGNNKKKQKEYADSKVTITKSMSLSDIPNWNMDSIIERDISTSDEILKILPTWDDAYNNITTGEVASDSVPSAEQQAMIEEFKKKGWE